MFEMLGQRDFFFYIFFMTGIASFSRSHTLCFGCVPIEKITVTTYTPQLKLLEQLKHHASFTSQHLEEYCIFR